MRFSTYGIRHRAHYESRQQTCLFWKKNDFFKLYNYSNKKGRLRMKESKNICTGKKHEKLSNKKMKIIYITLLLALLVELIIIIA